MPLLQTEHSGGEAGKAHRSPADSTTSGAKSAKMLQRGTPSVEFSGDGHFKDPVVVANGPGQHAAAKLFQQYCSK